MGEGAGEPEFHAAAQIRRVPVRRAIRARRVAGPGEVAGRVGRSGDRVSLVEMRMHVDEARPGLPASEVGGGQRGRSGVR